MKKLNRPQWIALIITLLVLVWVLSSFIFPPNSASSPDVAASSSVDLASILKIETMRATAHQGKIILYGNTEPNRRVAMKAETQGVVKAMPATEGQLLKEGEVIVEIDERDRRSRYAQAKALLEQREIEYNAAKRLQAEGFQTEIRLAEARTRLEEARVNLRQIDLDLQYTKLRAPFDGVLEQLNVEIGDFVGVGVFGGEGALATMVDHDPLTITGQISEKDREVIDREGMVSVRVLDGKYQPEGRIKYIASVADEKSRTFRIEVEIPNLDAKIPSGVTAELSLPSSQVMAYLISPAILALDDKGNVGVKLVDANNTVQFAPVTILDDGKDGMWVSGLPDEIRVITLGQAFVSAGQTLDAAQMSDGK